MGAVLASVAESSLAGGFWRFLTRPLLETPWTDWHGFWLDQVVADRYLVCYFLPLLPVLYFAPQRLLRPAIVLTGLAFLGWVFGAAYALFWLLVCCGLYALSERFATDLETRRVPSWLSVVGACLIVGGGYFLLFRLPWVQFPGGWSLWLWENARWVYPLGLRAYAHEPPWLTYFPKDERGIPNLPTSIFSRIHVIGAAYLAVRMLHYFSELYRGTIPRSRRGLLRFLAYTCYAPNLMQGPIERYDRFHEQMDGCRSRRGLHNLPFIAWRSGLGVFKCLVALLYFMPVVEAQLNSADYYKQPELIESTLFLFFGVYIHIFWLYLLFSGYCDLSAAMGRLLGYQQVENFAMPWLATSLRDFWRRWHISLSFLLRDYVYIAMGGNRRHVTLNLCVTFALIGIWHAPAFQFLLWGVVMGTMLRINQWWVDYAKRLDRRSEGAMPRLRRAWLRLWPLPQIGAWALTMFCFVQSLLVFFGGSAGWRVPAELLRRLTGA